MLKYCYYCKKLIFLQKSSTKIKYKIKMYYFFFKFSTFKESKESIKDVYLL